MNLSSLLPSFVGSANNLHNVLLPVCLVLGFAGLVYKIFAAYRERSLQGVWPYCVKMVVAFCALSTITQWDPILTGMVNDASAQAGLNQTGVLATFVQDVSKKFSLPLNTSGKPATQQQQQQTNPFLGTLQQAGSAVQSGLQATGSWISWAMGMTNPVTAPAQTATSVFGALSNAQTGVQAMLETLFMMVCLMLGMLGMWIMWLVQQVLAQVCWAVSPIFLGCILVPPLGQMAARFFTNYIAVLCWPIGWGIANLVTVALLNLALNPSNNTGLGALNFFGGGFIWWIGAGLWALFSSVAAPWLVTKALSAGEQPLISLFSAGVNTTQTTVSIATSAAAPVTGYGTAAGSIVAGTMAVQKSFARRPVSSGSNGSGPANKS